jgi:predicted dehydrogenase
VALVGAGAVANDAHLPAWREQPEAEVVWAIDVRPEAAEATAARWQIPRRGTDARAAVEDPDVDIIDFCTPPLARAAEVVPALEAGKHVLVEKPAALTLDEAAAMTRAADRSGRVLLVAENWPYASAPRRVRTLLAEGRLGDPFLLQATIEAGRLLQPVDPGSYIARLGYTFLVGIHALNLARVLMGEFAHVSACATPARIPSAASLIAERDMVVAARFHGGAIGAFNFTGRAQFAEPRASTFRLCGTRGSLEFDVHKGYVDLNIGGAQTRVEDPRPSLGYAEEVAHFLRCIRGEETPMTSIADQTATLRALLAVYESAMSGRTVVLQQAEDVIARGGTAHGAPK